MSHVGDQVPVEEVAQNNIDETTLPKRTRELTQKGKDYQIDQLKKRFSNSKSRIDRQCQLITESFETNNYQVVQQEMGNLDKFFAEAEDHHTRLIELLPDEEHAEQHNKREQIDEQTFKMKRQVCTWLKENESTSRSGRSRSRSSHHSAGSRHSHNSRRSKAASEVHSLKKEEDVLMRIQLAKKEELACQMRFEAVKMETEKAQLQLKLLRVQAREEKEQDEEEKEQVRDKKEKQYLKQTTHSAEPANVTSQGTDMLTAMMKLVDLRTAPDADIDVFSGDPLEYAYFRAAFRDVVERKVLDQSGRFTRLLKYTSGDAKELIKHCIHDGDSSCFDNAIQLLDKEYGDKELLTNLYLNKLRQWPKVTSNDAAAYKKLHRFLLSGLAFKRDGMLTELDSESIIRSCILAKMDRTVQEKWLRKVVRAKEKGTGKLIFKDLVKFVEHLSSLASEPSYSQNAYKNDPSIKSYVVNVEQKPTQPCNPPSPAVPVTVPECKKQVTFAQCRFCSQKHELEFCHEFMELDVKERASFIWQNRLCYNCLTEINKDHTAQSCTVSKVCQICREAHNSVMHGYKSKSMQSYAVVSDESISMCIVPVRLCHKEGDSAEIEVYALLDENCQGTFISETVISKLGVASRRTTITTETLNGQRTDPALAVEGLIVKPALDVEAEYGEAALQLPTAYSRKSLRCHIEDIPTTERIKHLSYLEHVFTKLPAYNESITLGLIIGANCPKALEPQQIIPSIDDGPYASRSVLGWRIIGPMSNIVEPSVTKCYKVGVSIPTIDVTTNQISNHTFSSARNVIDEETTSGLKMMYAVDFPEEANSEQQAMSREDLKFIKLMKDNVIKVDGHYQLPLPFKDPSPTIINNRANALHRLKSVKNKMLKDHQYRKEYTDFVNALLEKRYAVKSSYAPKEKSWYLPHFGVRHPKKKKLRVVFDCSAEYGEVCLNDMLLQGPDMTNSLIGVLLRFRIGKVAFMADIEAMFHQVHVPPEQQSFLKFFWWPNGDLQSTPEEYQMCVHIFGAVSSPSCANFALQQTVVDNDCEETEEGDTILNNFYVDDLLKSTDDNHSAIKILGAVRELCHTGGFNLTKFICRETEVNSTIPSSKLGSIGTKEISKQEMVERALGVQLCLEADTFTFRISLSDMPLTRRGILSTISSVFDPYGIAGPFILQGRKILQQITCLKDGWDSRVPDDLAQAWSAWRVELFELQHISVKRCYKPGDFGTVKDMSLHIFSDASEVGYGAACYLRQEDIRGNICVSLAFGKSRVSPIKSVTIPRLELTAATVSVKLGAMLRAELKQNLSDFYWTDSMIALGYIMNDTKRFRVFVANRCQKIRSYTKKEQWNHVESQHNPADHASRGISVAETEKVNHWLHGPSFLHGREDSWKSGKSLNVTPIDDDIEIRRTVCVNVVKTESSNYVINKLEEAVSCWKRMIRIVATMMIFCNRCHTKSDPTGTDLSSTRKLSVEMLQHAQLRILQGLQGVYLNNELELYNGITDQRKPTNSSNLVKLDPFVEDHLLKVGGRLKNSKFPDAITNPVIIPKCSKISIRIVEHFHKEVKHGGRTTTLNEIRQNGFWLIGANTIVRSVITNCVTCKAMRGKLCQQQMGNLPPERFSMEGPFTYTGLDTFGPYYVKECRKQLKRHVILFTCLSSRAIHLESIMNLETDSFIQALRRFVARRGKVRQIICDPGKNFEGAINELKRNFNEMDHEAVTQYLQSQSCDWIDWKTNPPKASHMGGVWERLIRSVRTVLSAILRDHSAKLNDESFRTLLAEAECVVNSRPLSTESLQDPTSLPLSPNSLLTAKNKVVLPPPGVFQKEDVFCRKRWRQVQHLANEFWIRWKKEYLQCLQVRQKWNTKTPNFQVNDIVLIKDENLPRNQWPLGRVVKTFPSETDGLVRQVQLHIPTAKSKLRRPIHKLVLLVGYDETTEQQLDTEQSPISEQPHQAAASQGSDARDNLTIVNKERPEQEGATEAGRSVRNKERLKNVPISPSKIQSTRSKERPALVAQEEPGAPEAPGAPESHGAPGVPVGAPKALGVPEKMSSAYTARPRRAAASYRSIAPCKPTSDMRVVRGTTGAPSTCSAECLERPEQK